MAAHVDVLGIRHHGPGSARSVRRVLDETRPAVVVIEGPPELDDLVAYAASGGLVPPVAAMVHALDEPRQAAFYPMAVFSPEWVALRWALEHDVPVHFADLPAANSLATPEDPGGDGRSDQEPSVTEPSDDEPTAGQPSGAGPSDAGPSAGEAALPQVVPTRPSHADPVGELARAGGYDDPERWWDDAVEHRDGALATFDVIRDAMTALRAETEIDDQTLIREAAMRRTLRPLLKGNERVAVVCGAWHAPVLSPEAFPTVKHDQDLLRGMPKTKVAATWTPWTSSRLGYRSGYGAGVDSPGWYAHCFETPTDGVVPGWLVKVAHALRREDLDASSASVIEAARLAQALATLRGRPLAGLEECTEAARAVLCEGSDVPLRLLHDEVVVGREMGSVPDDTPQVPLAKDLSVRQRACRLKPKASAETVVLDLRTPAGMRRSVLFHQLTLLDITWAVETVTGRTTGTFKEAWTLEWQPELAIRVVEAALWGTTVRSAATARVVERAGGDAPLADLARLAEACLPADLPDALGVLVRAIEAASATTHDTLALMQAVEPLARTVRYGTVRDVDTGALAVVLHAIVVRAAVGLGAACASLDDEAAARMRGAIDGVTRAVGLVADGDAAARWYRSLGGVADQAGVHGSVGGRVVRLLLDAGGLDAGEAERRLSRRLSRAAGGTDAAAWIDGFLDGPAILLLEDRRLLGVIDDWLAAAAAEVFDDVLPLLRRTFSRYPPAERRALAGKVRKRHGAGADADSHPGIATEGDGDIDDALAAPAVAKVLALLRGASR